MKRNFFKGKSKHQADFILFFVVSLEAALLHGIFPSQVVGIPKNVMLCSHRCFIFRNAHFFFSFFFGVIPSEYSLYIIGKEI